MEKDGFLLILSFPPLSFFLTYLLLSKLDRRLASNERRERSSS